MIAAIVLAAGQSRRMGRNKLLLPYGTSTVIETIVTEIAACPQVGDLVVVTGHEHEQIAAQLSRHPARCVFNPDYSRTDMLASIQTGLRALSDEVTAALVALGDQPRIRREVVQQIVDAHRPGAVIIPSHNMKRGHPIVIDRAWWPRILSLPPDGTLRDFTRTVEEQIRYVVVDDDSVLRDLDTPEDYAEMTG